MTYVHHDPSKNVDISKVKKLAVWFSLQKEWGGSVGQIISNQGAFVWFSRKYLNHDSVGLMTTNYLIYGSSSSFLEGESDSQFWDVKDVNVFTGLVVEIRHIASWHQKRHRKNSFSCSIQWCNPHLATMLRSGDI